MLKRFLDKTFNTITDYSLQAQFKDNLTTLKRQNSVDNPHILPIDDPEEPEEDEEDDWRPHPGRPGRGRMHPQQNRQKFEGEGIALIGDGSFDKDVSTIIEKLLATQRSVEKVNFHAQIVNLNQKLLELKNDHIKSSLKPQYTFEIKKSDFSIKINKLKLNFKSNYFQNLETTNLKEYRTNFIDLGFGFLDKFSNSSIEKVFNFLNQEEFILNYNEIFEILEIANYFMIDNLVSLIEVEMENLISMFINVYFTIFLLYNINNYF